MGDVKTKPVRHAHNAVDYAKRAGKIKPGKCHCGAPGEAHHKGYSKGAQLDVTWLCSKHHKTKH